MSLEHWIKGDNKSIISKILHEKIHPTQNCGRLKMALFNVFGFCVIVQTLKPDNPHVLQG